MANGSAGPAHMIHTRFEQGGWEGKKNLQTVAPMHMDNLLISLNSSLSTRADSKTNWRLWSNNVPMTSHHFRQQSIQSGVPSCAC
jgi:hypothetical protein